MKSLRILLTVFLLTLAVKANAQLLSNVLIPFSSCIGSTENISFTASGFPTGTLFEVQVSSPLGIFDANKKVVGSGASSPIQIYFYAGIQPAPSLRIRIVNKISQATYYMSPSFNLGNCGNKVVSTFAFSTAVNPLPVCLGTAISIPFASSNVSSLETFGVEYKKQGQASFTRIASSINNQRTQATVSIPLNFGTSVGTLFRVIAMDALGITTATGSTSITIADIASCFTINDLSPVCKTSPQVMAYDSLLKGSRTGIPTSSLFTAILSNATGGFPVTPVASFSSNTFPVAVNYPCTLPSGTGYKWYVTAKQNGTIIAETYSRPFSIQSCAASLSVKTTTLGVKGRYVPPGGSNANYDSVCLGSPESRILLSATGCFNANNQFSLRLRSDDPTFPVVNIPLTSLKNPITFPRTIKTGFYSLQLVSTNPSLQSVETNLIRFVNCRKITLNSVCKSGTSVFGTFTPEGDFPSGTQYRLYGETAIFNTSTYGTYNYGSPLSINTSGEGPLSVTYRASSSTGILSGNTITSIFADLPTCPTSSITLLPPASASICKLGLLTLSFTKTGLVDSMSRFQAVLTSAEGAQFVMNAKYGKSSSPLTFDIPNIGNSASYSLKLTTNNQAISSNTLFGLVLGNCPTIATGAFAAGQSFCSGSQVLVPFTTTGTFDAGNQFKVELSSEIGNFTSPITVGTGAASPITAILPHFILAGGAYKLRVVSTAPYVKPPSYTPAFSIISSPTVYNIAAQTNAANQVLHSVVGTGFTQSMQVLYGVTPATYSYTSPNMVFSNLPPATPAGLLKVKVGGCFSNGLSYTIPAIARLAVDQEETSDQLLTSNASASLYPNPVKESATFRPAFGHGKTSFRLINMVGREIASGSIDAEENEKILDLSREPKGIYILMYANGNEIKEIKLVKE